MKRTVSRRPIIRKPFPGGFSLIASVLVMGLLLMVALGLLSLSSISLRSGTTASARQEARANARLALTIALGELQKEMGPDMRVSSQSALLDQDPQSEPIEGVQQSRWIASYDSWGNWLNAEYEHPRTGRDLEIQDTYSKGREAMFRRWLVSLPVGQENNINAPLSLNNWNDGNSVVLLGEGTLGSGVIDAHPDRETRAFLIPGPSNGRLAWWVEPENHKAKTTLAKRQRDLTNPEWEVAQGSTAEVGVGALAEFSSLDNDAEIAPKLISHRALEFANPRTAVEEHFTDLTAYSMGVLASVRAGHLKKDLTLLLEKEAHEMPPGYDYTVADYRDLRTEPSIRPWSQELQDYLEASHDSDGGIPERRFASWTNMRHFYKMYQQNAGAFSGDIGGTGTLDWNGPKPQTTAQMPLIYRDRRNFGQWMGNNSYIRMPILAKLTFIYSLMTRPVGSNTPQEYDLYMVYTPVFTYWNPYNVELRIPDNLLGNLSSTYQVLPMGFQYFEGLNSTPTRESELFTGNSHSFLRSGNGSEIVFKPGEIRLFSHQAVSPQKGGQRDPLSLMPGFDPFAYGGDENRIQRRVRESVNPGLIMRFGHSVWGGNVNYGNTPGSLNFPSFYLADHDRIRAFNWNLPVMYQHDWLNLSQTQTLLNRNSAANINRWVFSDSQPLPIAFVQLTLKGASEYSYESIDWARDWRSRNWLHAPPFNFGSGTYISEDDNIAHTQRIDSPYVLNFGPISNAELPKVVFHQGPSAFWGSGATPFEKVNAVPALELPSAPVGSLAGFSGMRTLPGFVNPQKIHSRIYLDSRGGAWTGSSSYAFGISKVMAYQSGITGPGIGNSFCHQMIPRSEVYHYFNNSVSTDPNNRGDPFGTTHGITYNDTHAYCDFWDHTFLLNDSLWDDYFVSTLANQVRPSAPSAESINSNIQRLIDGERLAEPRFKRFRDGRPDDEVEEELADEDGWLMASGNLLADGMFNVNSTSVDAWFSLFAGIRERQLVYRDQNGNLQPVAVPADKRIAVSRFNTPTTGQEMSGPEFGINRADGTQAWSGVRFLSEDQLRKLAVECVKQVKLRGPFLNMSEFINRRLSDDPLGLMGALQSAIDYDDGSPDSSSINFAFKSGPGFMMTESDLGAGNQFATPQAANGSRFAGIPGYVVQSDLLKPIGNTLNVRDDTFRVRAYGESRDPSGNVLARAWCESIVQRTPEYNDPSNHRSEPSRALGANGSFTDNENLSELNKRFGRKIRVVSFRWLDRDEV